MSIGGVSNGSQNLKKNKNKNSYFGKRSLVEQDDGWKFILGLSVRESVSDSGYGHEDIHALIFM